MPNAAPRGQFESASGARATGLVAVALRAVSTGAVTPKGDDLVAVSLDGEVAYRSVTSRRDGPSYHLRADWISIPNLTPDPQGEYDVIAGGSLSPVSAGTTFYLGLFGSLNETLVGIPMPACTITELRCRATSGPGAGKSFAYTLRKNGVDQGSLAVTITESATEGADTGSVSFSAGDRLGIKLITATGSAEAYHLWSVKLQLAS